GSSRDNEHNANLAFEAPGGVEVGRRPQVGNESASIRPREQRQGKSSPSLYGDGVGVVNEKAERMTACQTPLRRLLTVAGASLNDFQRQLTKVKQSNKC